MNKLNKLPDWLRVSYPDLMRLAAEGGFDINGTNSGILLTTEEHKFSNTYGSHHAYNQAVLADLSAINLNQSPQAIAAAVQAIANSHRANM